MVDYSNEFLDVIKGVSEYLGKMIDVESVEIIDRGVPHIPQTLNAGTMAVYIYCYKGQYLKIGKAGPKSNARFHNQHYNPKSAKSTLAASILADKDMENLGITEGNVGDWIKGNCRRIDILMNASLGIFALELVEAALHYKYEPKYEGFSSQRPNNN